MKYFQIIDSKNGCYSYYYDGKIYKVNELPREATKTLSFHESFTKNTDIAYLYAGGKSHLQILDDSVLVNQYESVLEAKKSHLKSLLVCGIDINEFCFYDAIPEHFVIEYSEAKNQLAKKVFETHKRPLNYNLLFDTARLCNYISEKTLKFNKRVFQDANKGHFFLKNKVIYNQFGTVTGRFTTKSNSFGILNLSKQLRKYVQPNNKYIVELDFNAAEIRTSLGAAGIDQPEGDIYEWFNAEFYNNQKTRDWVKKKVISWLYDSSNSETFEGFLDKNKILEEYYMNGHVITPFNRKILCDENHAINYLIQSTTNDIVLSAAIKIMDILIDSNSKSRLYFTIHDAIYLDLAEDEEHVLDEAISIMENTLFGVFKTKISIGKNLGTLKEI